MWSLSMYDAEHPSSALKAAVAANVLAPPSLTLEQVLELQEAEIAEYSKTTFQTELYAALESGCPEEKAHLRQELCLKAQVPIVGRFGFEPTALGVSQATLAILRHHGEPKACMHLQRQIGWSGVPARAWSQAVSTVSKREVDQDEFQEILEEQGLADFKEEEPVKPKMVERTEFESLVGVLIAINSIVMGLEADAPDKRSVGWVIVENFFCLLWISEMMLKLWFYHLAYFKSGWNVFDFCLVLLNIFETWVIPSLAIEDLDALGVLRIVRVLRILRLLRLIRLMRLFKNLWLIIVGFRESLSTLFWVLMLLSVVVYVFAIFLRLTLSCPEQFQHWIECDDYFGTMPKSMYTLFQIITLESWSQEFARPIVKQQPMFFLFFMFFLFLTTFGILNIIVGVIVENTLNAAKQNMELQERRLQRQLRQELESIRILFEDADADGSGTLEKDEFIQILVDEAVKNTLTRMEVPVDDPGTLFEILDPQGSGSISFPVFAQGVLRVKGPPTQLDMKTMQVGVAGISRRVTKVEQAVENHTQLIRESMQMLGQILEALGHKGQVVKPGYQDTGPTGDGGDPGYREDVRRDAGGVADKQDAMEVESIHDPDSPKMRKQMSNDSLELLRETASSFEVPVLGVPVPRLVIQPKAKAHLPGQLES
ncbi:Scn10a [Symbiodinium pilosum]|uniref:Scn10a protein n=1 Tax=Symbiodinium pilosum TaxID=2952 RepID=A0A812V130_SYMPI|nr:Scn10a [Symbiodinium pilosum]